MNTERYDRLTRCLHWVSAVVVIWASVSGFSIAALEPGSAIRDWLSWFNVSLTTVFTPVFAIRVVHACRMAKPRGLDVPDWQRRVASLVHALLYALTSVVLASGILMMDHDIDVFGLFMLTNPLEQAAWNRTFYKVHRQSSALLFLLVIAHVAAVIRHHRAGRRVLIRMT